jgi:hypothetical protein
MHRRMPQMAVYSDCAAAWVIVASSDAGTCLDRRPAFFTNFVEKIVSKRLDRAQSI